MKFIVATIFVVVAALPDKPPHETIERLCDALLNLMAVYIVVTYALEEHARHGK